MLRTSPLPVLAASLALAAGCATETARNVPSATPTVLAAAAATAARVRVTVANDGAAAAQLAAAGVTLDARPESFAALSTPAETLVVGRDDAGALYGALEIAERLESAGAAALPLAAPLTGS